jgi:hypothetical protein
MYSTRYTSNRLSELTTDSAVGWPERRWKAYCQCLGQWYVSLEQSFSCEYVQVLVSRLMCGWKSDCSDVVQIFPPDWGKVGARVIPGLEGTKQTTQVRSGWVVCHRRAHEVLFVWCSRGPSHVWSVYERLTTSRVQSPVLVLISIPGGDRVVV